MLIILVSWCLITYFALCMGLVFNKVWCCLSKQKRRITLDETVMAGLCTLTVYAQIFSLFHGVGFAANLLLTGICVIITCFCYRELLQVLDSFIKMKRIYWLGIAVALVIISMIGAGGNDQYDTGLYHAQAVRWIEEYGVVKGLGCLHHRLAYNSSFLVLQALFGYRYLFGLEIHSLNVYIAFILILWAGHAFLAHRTRMFSLSDMGRLLFLVYICKMRESVSSPGTDFFAVSLSIYILTKWLVLTEERCGEAEPYIYLCFLAVYAVTLKLSVAPIALLAVYPLYLLIKDKRFQLMGISAATGAMIAAPFLIRNVILCGYLLFPFPSIDLFSVDWKLGLDEVIRYKQEVAVWGRGLCDMSKADYSIGQWFPVWWSTLSFVSKVSVILFLITFVIAVVRCVVILCSHKPLQIRLQIPVIYLTECAMVFFWFLAAPTMRFGAIFLLFVPFTLAGEILSIWKPAFVSKLPCFIVLLPTTLLLMIYALSLEKHVIVPKAYTDYAADSCELSGITIYYPKEGDRIGYSHFPSTPYADRIREDMIELRDEKQGIREGFRMKAW